ncbi:hypothetical protein ABPG75_006437 [Micractinium tetrahymenae]
MPRAPLVLLVAAAVVALAAAASPPLAGYPNAAAAASAARQLAFMSARDKRKLFSQWKRYHGKSYADGSREDDRRYRGWLTNLSTLIVWNQKRGIKYFRGMTPFSDQPFLETYNRFLMKRANPTRARVYRQTSSSAAAAGAAQGGTVQAAAAAIPDEWDWRDLAVVPKIRPPQGDCGSCYAYAAIAALEVKVKIDGTDDGPNLSEQQAVDCVNAARGYSSALCNGGYPEEVFNYVSNSFAATEVAYRYTAHNGTCRASTVSKAGAITLSPSPGFLAVPGRPPAIASAVRMRGPVTVYFNVEESFLSYTSGIYPASACRSDGINHAMVIVGYSLAERYLILRNSWGETWGEGGYARMEMAQAGNNGSCGMYLYGGAVPLSTQPLAPTSTRFDWPKINGGPVDYCWGIGADYSTNQCGLYVARRWCWAQGFTGGYTRFQQYGTSQECRDPSCTTFRSITCGSQGAPAGGPPVCKTSDLFFDIEFPDGNLPGSPFPADSYAECCALCSSKSACKRWDASTLPALLGDDIRIAEAWLPPGLTNPGCWLKGPSGWYEHDSPFKDCVSGVPTAAGSLGPFTVVGLEFSTVDVRCYGGLLISQIMNATWGDAASGQFATDAYQ